MRYFIIVLLSLFFFNGCSSKINPAEFHKIEAPKSYNPSYNEIIGKTNVLIADFKGRFADEAKNYLSYILNNSKSIKLLSRKFKSIKEEIKLAELAKNSASDLNQADYLIFGRISNVSTSYKYHKPYTYKDKKGKIHYVRGYYTHKACIDGNLKIIKIPENYIANNLFFGDCEYENKNSKYFNYNPLIKQAIKNSIYSIKNSLYRFFAKRGYVYEIRKKDDEIILHTTLGSEFGAKEGERVNIYRVKKIKIPFTNKEKIQIIKIGEGIIKIAHPSNSWILVEEGKNFMIGDFVRMNYKYSFWDIFK